ncbi:EF-hand domain-containing protein [Sulfitobacter sp.]|uniref:EF-hand domain-containing protein n=1 Tax=Sulfitobacter sp. TaxID=1903071 RepID=UPI003002C942
MNHKTLLAATALAATVIGGTAFADSNHGHKGKTGSNDQAGMMHNGGPGMMDMMGMMQRMHGEMMGGGMMGGGMMGGGMMVGMGPMGGDMMQKFDTDGDGTVTPDEMRTQLQAKLTEFDSDGDSALSIAEFETLHSAMIREMMVDKFQHLDADGDGTVTAEEMTAPAEMMDRMEKVRAKMGMMQGKQEGNGTMKTDN